MIEKIPFETEKITHNGKTMEIDTHASPYDLQIKINEIIDAVNEFGKDMVFLRRKVLELGYKEPDQYKSITFMSDGHIKKFYGHDSIVELEVPLPQGTKITIRSIAKGGDNE